MSLLQSKRGVTAKRQLPFSQPKTIKLRRQYDPANLQRAVDAMKSGMSAYRAARVFGAHETTLKDRRLGNVAMGANPGPSTLFTASEEGQLVNHIKYMASIGYGYTKANVQYLAVDLALSLGKKTSSEKPLSDSWFYSFMNRWSDLKLATPQKLSMLRAKSASREVLDNYFHELGAILENNDLNGRPERIFNIDETGINTEHTPPKVVCSSSSQAQACTSPRSGTVTIIGSGNAVGNHIPPYYIFPGKRWNELFLEGAPPGSAGEMSDSGWSNKDIFHKYLTKHFVKHANISEDENSPKTLVLFDGHKSHISLTLVEWAKSRNIILFVLPPHTSHITQPLDIGVFGPLKSMYHRECQLFLQKNPGQHVTKYEVASLTSKPYLRALSAENLASSFRKAGIYPFSNTTIGDSQVAPSTIYPQEEVSEKGDAGSFSNEDQDKENEPPVNAPTQQVSPSTSFFQSRTITTVVKKNKKEICSAILSWKFVKTNERQYFAVSKNQIVNPCKY